ncbi:MAG: SAM-dependent methyltransferase, partial [Deltaproteobacteria bacterium]|nr:SAM-dependent methyltransferase [Deltaproteobacteria bacterium]
MINFLQFMVFLPIQILFIPFVILGMIPAMYKEMIVSKKLGVSFTAGQAIQNRWIMHYLKTRPDEKTVKFIKVLPIESHFGLLCFMGAAIIANKICGYTPGLARVPEPGKEVFFNFLNTRTTNFDRIMKKNLEHVEQVVIMGAGYDLRVLDLARGRNVKIFELDQEKTQNLKLQTMKKAGIDDNGIIYIPVDFTEESWVEKLIKNGFDKTKKTFFLWESVSIYLEEDVVKDTLIKLSKLCAKGSIIAQDFYSKAFITGETTVLIKRSLRLLEKMGEPWLFGIDMSEDAKRSMESLLNDSGLALKDFV